MDTRRRLVALIPLQTVIALLAIHNIARPERVPQIAGWIVLGGVLATIAGYAVAWRGRARRAGD